ncbi:MAG: hypothetical protein NTW28_17105 [Candidatus Solibacter sp.]|nr:hypothetical protein [Candidatus Solibacter sp.]
MMGTLVSVRFQCCAVAPARAHPALDIHNARVVTVSGSVINKGTVVVRNGLIEVVGENVAIPSDAVRVEGEGLSVYPGLIDALITLGKPGAEGQCDTVIRACVTMPRGSGPIPAPRALRQRPALAGVCFDH